MFTGLVKIFREYSHRLIFMLPLHICMEFCDMYVCTYIFVYMFVFMGNGFG